MNNLLKDNKRLMLEYNYEKNKDIDLNNITLGSQKEIWWKCQKGHEWPAKVKERNRGNNCPYCSNKKVLIGYNDLYTYCINNHREDLIKEFDNEKNSFKMEDLTFGSRKEILWKCSICGHEWPASPYRRISRKSGCGVCSHNLLKKGVNDLATTNPEIAKEWDYKKNTKMPDEVMAGSNNKKYWFICPKGHSYKATPLDRKKGNGCPQCNLENHTSFPERAIYYYLKKYLDNCEASYHNSTLGRKELDIFLPKFNFAIEYDGRAWHKNYKKDLEKDKVCQKNNIILLRVREIGCFEYDSNSIKKYISPYNIEELNDAIFFIFNYLNSNFNLSINADIDVDRDKTQILELMNLTEKENSIANYCPQIKKYWNYEKNGKITPEQISHSSEKEVSLKCPECNNEWDILVKDFKLRPKCPFCYGRKIKTGYNDLFSTNPELMEQWSKNNILDPRKIGKGCNFSALWYCSICHGEYDMQVNDKAKGYGCPFCSGHRVLKGYNDLATTCPELMKEWDFEKNEIRPEQITKGSNESVYWKCHICNHEWKTAISNRGILNRGCPRCSKKRATSLMSKKVLQFSTDGSLIAEFDSAADAIRKTGISKIPNVCRNERKTAGGYIWKYKNNID